MARKIIPHKRKNTQIKNQTKQPLHPYPLKYHHKNTTQGKPMETLESVKTTVFVILVLMLAYGSSQQSARRKRMSREEKFEKDMKALGAIVIGTIAFFLIANFFIDANAKSDVKEKTAHFQKGKELMCGAGRFSKSNEGYLVSKRSGWSLKGDEHFLKGDILINISSCDKN
jgi:hypothetical protein